MHGERKLTFLYKTDSKEICQVGEGEVTEFTRQYWISNSELDFRRKLIQSENKQIAVLQYFCCRSSERNPMYSHTAATFPFFFYLSRCQMNEFKKDIFWKV